MDGSMFIGTWWSLVPPLLAIVLALVTKEVYSSLLLVLQWEHCFIQVSIRGMHLLLFLIS